VPIRTYQKIDRKLVKKLIVMMAEFFEADGLPGHAVELTRNPDLQKHFLPGTKPCHSNSLSLRRDGLYSGAI
jgi:hypothetical protein